MDLSCLIPSFGRPEKLAACTRALAGQRFEPGRFEVLVGLDGPDERSRRSALAAWHDAGGAPDQLRILDCPREGYNAVRNRLLELARGRVLVSLNDDVLPAPEFLWCHWQAQCEHRAAIITGASPWLVPPDDTLFDRLVRETSMVFFFDRMDATAVERDWGYRHAWGLNCSMPTDAVRDVGGWTAFPLAYGYDDIELAYRLQERYALPVLYRPAACAPHDHRYDLEGYLRREFRLGCSAWLFARDRPQFARALFGRDLTDAREVTYSAAFVAQERSAAADVLGLLRRLATLPACAVDGPQAPLVITALYQLHLPLKRWMWRAGVLSAAHGRPDAEPRWPDAQP